jgi:hypothetical protein
MNAWGRGGTGGGFGKAALVEVEFALGDVADGEMGSVYGWEVATSRLEEDEFEAVVVRSAIGCGGVHMSGVVPPFGQVVVCAFVLREVYWWERLRLGRYLDLWQLLGR